MDKITPRRGALFVRHGDDGLKICKTECAITVPDPLSNEQGIKKSTPDILKTLIRPCETCVIMNDRIDQSHVKSHVTRVVVWAQPFYNNSNRLTQNTLRRTHVRQNHPEYKEPISHEPSAPVRRTIQDAKHNEPPLQRAEQPLKCKTH